MILGTGYGLRFSLLFKFLKSLMKLTRCLLGLGCAKDGHPQSESFDH